MPLDQYQRDINYLRISLTDRCNLRCVYCMPLTGIKFLPTDQLLSAEEIASVAQVAVSIGFRKFRLTGGEPTVRTDLIEIVERLNRIPGIGELSMTTNGIMLPQLAKPLARAGLKRVNLHVDSLHAERLSRIMRWATLEKMWNGIEAAEAAGLLPIKLNSVIAKGYNDEDIIDLAKLTVDRDWHVRFIEMMPFGIGDCSGIARNQLFSNEEAKLRIEQQFGELMPLPETQSSDESRNYRIPGARGIIGFISPVSAPYCGSCNRMRLTADGKLHLCLLTDDEMDIKKQLRENGPEAVRPILQKAVRMKPIGHRLDEGVFTQNRKMYQIGG